MGGQPGVETFSILWFLIHLFAVAVPLRYGRPGGARRYARRCSAGSAHDDSEATFSAARWQLAAQGVVIRFVLQGLAGIE